MTTRSVAIGVILGDFAVWKTRIIAAWNKSREAIFEVGRLLLEAKAALPHGSFTKMIESELPFGARTAQMLMAITSDPWISNPKHASVLPVTWGTLYQLTTLDQETRERLLADGTIRPDMARKDILAATQGEVALPSDDFWWTPPEALLPLYPYLKRRKRIWEPACGTGNIVNALISRGHSVVGTDIKRWSPEFERLDFLSATELPHFDYIVTNPPYSRKDEFLERCYELGKPFALILPTEALHSEARHAFYRKYGVEVIVFDRRVPFETPYDRGKKSKPNFPTGWFTFGLNIGQALTFAQYEDNSLALEGQPSLLN